jgi:homoserine kinase
VLPALPAGTVAVAVSGAGPDALVLGTDTFADYQLGAGDRWVRAEHFGVSIPYGSSS